MSVTEQLTIFHKMIKDLKILANFDVIRLPKSSKSFAGTARISLRYMLTLLSK